MITINVQMIDAQGDEVDVALPAHWVICDQCRGEGKSSAYLGAFSREDMEEEGPEFQEDYMRGDYDRPCAVCDGSGKELVPDVERINTPEQVAALEHLEQRACEDAEYRRVQRYEDGDFSY